MKEFGTKLFDSRVLEVTGKYLRKSFALSITTVEEFVGMAIAAPKDFAAYLEISEEELTFLIKKLEPYIEPELLAEFKKPVPPHPLGANRPPKTKD